MKYNTTKPIKKTTNLEGGEAYTQTAALELVSLLVTSFVKDKFYEKETTTVERLKALLAKVPVKFAAQAIVFARTKFGMRSVSHVAASELAKRISGEPFARKFYNAVVYRPDDILEITAYHKAKNGKLSAAMKAGFAQAITEFSPYELAKYKGEGKGVKLVDAVNMFHPKPSEKNEDALTKLVKGELKSFDTWEVDISAAGSDPAAKAAAWAKLIYEKKIGYFALLKNLRNIIEDAPDALPAALIMLTDEKLIKNSLVLPFRFMKAYDEILKVNEGKARVTLSAIAKAIDIAVSNVPVFEGETLVVLDVSGSMEQNNVSEIGSMFAAALVKSNNADLVLFSEYAKYVNYNISDTTLTIAKSIKYATGQTYLDKVFALANKRYDRIIILSDMQAYGSPVKPAFAEYKLRTGADPYIYSFDLAGYGTMQFPERSVFAVAGFSEKIFDIMKWLETDRGAFLKEVEKIEL